MSIYTARSIYIHHLLDLKVMKLPSTQYNVKTNPIKKYSYLSLIFSTGGARHPDRQAFPFQRGTRKEIQRNKQSNIDTEKISRQLPKKGKGHIGTRQTHSITSVHIPTSHYYISKLYT